MEQSDRRDQHLDTNWNTAFCGGWRKSSSDNAIVKIKGMGCWNLLKIFSHLQVQRQLSRHQRTPLCCRPFWQLFHQGRKQKLNAAVSSRCWSTTASICQYWILPWTPLCWEQSKRGTEELWTRSCTLGATSTPQINTAAHASSMLCNIMTWKLCRPSCSSSPRLSTWTRQTMLTTQRWLMLPVTTTCSCACSCWRLRPGLMSTQPPHSFLLSGKIISL